jgi:glutamine amidotransferase
MKTVIINYGSGNLRSVEKGVLFASQSLDMEVKVTACSDEVRSADRIILPGVGSFADCMKGLTAVSGMRAALEEVVIERGRPFLGICVGMQLLADLGLEHVRSTTRSAQ